MRRKIRLVKITLKGKWKKRDITFTSGVIVAAQTIGQLIAEGKAKALSQHFSISVYHKNQVKLLEAFKITAVEIVHELGLSNDVYPD